MQAASCTDAIKNGDESDVDCGGACEAKCAVSKRCMVPDDCMSSVCQNGLCQVRDVAPRLMA